MPTRKMQVRQARELEGDIVHRWNDTDRQSLLRANEIEEAFEQTRDEEHSAIKRKPTILAKEGCNRCWVP